MGVNEPPQTDSAPLSHHLSPVWKECGKGYLIYQGWSQRGLCYRIRERGWGENLNWDQRESVEFRPTASFERLVNA